MDIENIKKDFPFFTGQYGVNYSYLDNAASAQKPAVVIEAMRQFDNESYSNVHRGVYKVAEAATEAYENGRKFIAEYIGASRPEEIIFTRNATSALNLLASTLGSTLKEGDKAVLTEMEHHANLVPWQQAAKRYKFELVFWPITDDGRLDYSAIDKVITKNTKVVSVTAMSNVLGTVNELDVIIKKAKSVGAYVIVDGSQGLPHLKTNVSALGCDAYVATAHKAYGPSGLGFVYGKYDFLNKLPPYEFGGHMINTVDWYDSTWSELPFKFEPGTPPITQVVGAAEALKYLNKIGIDEIVKHEEDVTEYGLVKLLEIPGLKIVGPTDAKNRGPVFAFTVEGVHPHDMASALDSVGVAVRSGHHCAMPLHTKFGLQASTRASFGLYNTRADIDKLVNGIKKAKEIFL